MKMLIAITLLFTFALTGCQRSVVPVAQAQAVARPTQPVTEVKVHHLCGAKTKKGKACRKPVKNEGDRCWIHAGQPAL